MNCARCGVHDRIFVRRSDRCSCGAEGGEFAPDGDHIERVCQMAAHWVVQFIHPDYLRERELTVDPNASHGVRLPLKYRGWMLQQRLNVDGEPISGQFVRTKLLCRDCIVVEQQIDRQMKEHDRSWQKQRDKGKTKGFAETICSQDYL